MNFGSIMETTEQEGGLQSVRGERIALRSVAVKGSLDGLLFGMTVRQDYVNDTGQNLEIVYTFPLPWGTALLGLEAVIGGRRLQGVVIEKKEAEQKYEEAIKDGDSPIMVQQSGSGLYTANLGNIKDGESVSIEIRSAALLRFEQGRIRLKIPTVIAPRYGDEHEQGGLAPHETTAVDLAARYPLSVRLDLHGEAARASIFSPSHKIKTNDAEDGVSVELQEEAMLDRDFILLLEGLAGHSFALSAPDGDAHMELASFCPKLPARSEPLALKILVDCSGSMQGGSIAQAKNALQKVLQELNEGDFVSYSRFGSEVKHLQNSLQACTPVQLEALSQAVARTDAVMGGTEMDSALQSVYKDISIPAHLESSPCVLLITDDLVWNNRAILKSALKSGHRIFAVGVSQSPAECLLRDMAEQTGGACESVTPNEDIAAAVIRMFHRMRGMRPCELRLDWGAEPLWQSPLPKVIYDGETLHVFAAFADAPAAAPQLHWKDEAGHEVCTAPPALTHTTNTDVARLGGAKRMDFAQDSREALALALKYQIVSEHSSMFLVYLREGEDKVTELPQIQQVPQMLAEGYGGYSRLSEMGIWSMDMALNYVVAPAMSHVPHRAMRYLTSPRPQPQPANPTRLKDLLRELDKAILSGQAADEALRRVIDGVDDDLKLLIKKLSKSAKLSPEDGWAVMLLLAGERLGGGGSLSRQTLRFLRSKVDALAPEDVEGIHSILEVEFPFLKAPVSA